MRRRELEEKADIPWDKLKEALIIAEQRRHIERIMAPESTLVQEICITSEGIEYYRLEMRSTGRRVWDSLKPNIRKVIIGTIIVVIGGLILHIFI